MNSALGRPLRQGLQPLSAEEQPQITETTAPGKHAAERANGTLRVIACRDGQWIVARFQDGAPKGMQPL